MFILLVYASILVYIVYSFSNVDSLKYLKKGLPNPFCWKKSNILVEFVDYEWRLQYFVVP